MQKSKKKNSKDELFADDLQGEDDLTLEEPDEDEHDVDEAATAIEDPVRMYLMQMGEIPMLSREMEVSSAKRIERTRSHFRRTMLSNDYILHGAAELLQKVASGDLRLDRTIEISVTNTTEKKRVLKRIGPNLENDPKSPGSKPD